MLIEHRRGSARCAPEARVWCFAAPFLHGRLSVCPGLHHAVGQGSAPSWGCDVVGRVRDRGLAFPTGLAFRARNVTARGTAGSAQCSEGSHGDAPSESDFSAVGLPSRFHAHRDLFFCLTELGGLRPISFSSHGCADAVLYAPFLFLPHFLILKPVPDTGIWWPLG